MADKEVSIGLIGFGTVGSGVAKIILDESERIAKRTGIRLKLSAVVDLDTTSPRPVTLPDGLLTSDIDSLINNKNIDIAVELVGGTTFAKDLHIKLLESGKHVVTANKALLATFGTELFNIARRNNRCIAFEASCAGGIPIVSGLRTGLVANNINALYGIINGTCNYILSSMSQQGQDFTDALEAAQAKGFAEADPTLDIGGGDSSHKLAILCSIAFGCELDHSDISTEGIEYISIDDINYGKELGYEMKLLAIGQRSDSGKISLSVGPAFISSDDKLAKVSGSFNAISIFGDAVGHVMFYGRGAGMLPTASAVVADIVEIALGNSLSIFSGSQLLSRAETSDLIEDMDNSSSRFYIRLSVEDKPGVLSRISDILATNGINISSILQHEICDSANNIPVIITTDITLKSHIDTVLGRFVEFDAICAEPVCIKIVDIPTDSD